MSPSEKRNPPGGSPRGAGILNWAKKAIGLASTVYGLMHGLQWGSRAIMVGLIGVGVLVALDWLWPIVRAKGALSSSGASLARSRRRVARIAGVLGMVGVVSMAGVSAWLLPGGVAIDMAAVLPTDDQLRAWSSEIDSALIAYIDEVVLPREDGIAPGTRWSSLDPDTQDGYLAEALQKLGAQDRLVKGFLEERYGETIFVSPFELVLKIKSSYGRPVEVWAAEVVVFNGQYLKACASGAGDETSIPDLHVLRYSATLDPTLGVADAGEPYPCNEFETQYLAALRTSDLHLHLRNRAYGTEDLAFGLYDIEVRLRLSNGRTVSSERLQIVVPTLGFLDSLVAATSLDVSYRFRASDPCCQHNYCAVASFDRSSSIEPQPLFAGFESVVAEIQAGAAGDTPNPRFAAVAAPGYCQSPSVRNGE